MIIKICLQCKKKFKTFLCRRGIFDSKKCAYLFRRGKPRTEELKEKMRVIAKERGYGKWMKGRIGILSPKWRGGKPNCKICKKILSRHNSLYCEKHKGIPFKEKKRSTEIGKKISLSKKGKKHPKQTGVNAPNWKGGITPINKKIRGSLEMKKWRETIFKRDNWTCTLCYVRSKKNKAIILHADHIKPFAYFPDLRFDLNNGRTLCKDCHSKTDTFCGRSKRMYQQVKI